VDSRRNADDALAIVRRGDDAGDVRAVAEVIERIVRAGDLVLAAFVNGLELRLVVIDASIDDRDVNRAAAVERGAFRDRPDILRVHGVDAPRRGLLSWRDRVVHRVALDDRLDVL